MMQSMTSYKEVYISQCALVSSLKYVSRFCLSKVRTETFCCLNAQKPHMCDKKGRTQTFPNSWYDQEIPTPHELVDAVFYCMGSGDRVNCFYCGEQ